MKKVMTNIGGLLLFYLIIVIGVLLLNARFSYLNSLNNNQNSETLIAMNN